MASEQLVVEGFPVCKVDRLPVEVKLPNIGKAKSPELVEDEDFKGKEALVK